MYYLMYVHHECYIKSYFYLFSAFIHYLLEVVERSHQNKEKPNE